MVELIITEKPTASKRVAEALADKKPTKKTYKKVTYYELTHKGKNILVGCAVGHLFNLTEKEKPNNNYINFNLEWKPSYQVSKSAEFTKKYFDTLKFLVKQSDEFIGATDLDTEGETILSTILKFICKVKNAKRMRFSTLTKEDLIKAYENLSPTIDKSLAESGETRHYLDFYFGISSSRALTSSLKSTGQFKILSSGRVQSPVLVLLAHKELDIEKFKSKPFWQLYAHLNAKNNLLLALHEKDKFWKQDEIKKILNKCKDKEAIVKKITKKTYKSLPPTPFNITSLQTESYRLFKFSPKQTMDIAQSLYLKAYIAYPRTSSEKLPPQINYFKILRSLSKLKEFNKNSEKILSNPIIKPREGVKTDPAHISIYPTYSPPKSIKKLSEQERKIYTLIVKRFLSIFANSAIKESMEIQFDINKEIFKIKGARILEPGWIEFYKPFAEFKEEVLPELKENEKYEVKKLEIKQDETKPPNRYSQGSIISEMEKKGLGTRATRSQILHILYERDYIKDKSIHVTPLGKAVASVLEKYVPDLVSEELTRHFEEELEKIIENKINPENILEESKEHLIKVLNKFKKNEKEIGRELVEALKETRKKASVVGECPNCKKRDLRILYSKKFKSYFVACSGYPKCKTTFSLTRGLPKPTNKKCPECNYPLIQIIRKGTRPFFYCFNKSCPKRIKWVNENKEKIEEFKKNINNSKQ